MCPPEGQPDLLLELWVIVKTSRRPGADADGAWSLDINYDIPAPQFGVVFERIRFPDLPYDEHERGRSDIYRLELGRLNIDAWLIGNPHEPGNIDTAMSITYHSNDAWLVESIWVVGCSQCNDNILYVAEPRWNKWFSQERERDAPAARKVHFLPKLKPPAR